MLKQKDLDRFFQLDSEIYDLEIEQEHLYDKLNKDINRILKAICNGLGIFPCLNSSDIIVRGVYNDYCAYDIVNHLLDYDEEFITSSCNYSVKFPTKFFTMKSSDIIKQIKNDTGAQKHKKKINKILTKLNNEEIEILREHLKE